MSKVKDSLNELLVTVFNYITNIEGVSLKNLGVKISMNEVHIIEAINNTEIPTMTNVASRLLITSGTLTTAINKLVSKGYVTRHQEENDRRKVMLKLTKAGFEVIKIHDLFHNEMIENAIKDMKIEEDSQLLMTIDNLAVYFKNKYEERIEKSKNQ